ncbi:MAG: SIMPL domain-containing protein [Patescibacteria group bacterium]
MEHESKDVKLDFSPNPQGPMKYLVFLVLATLILFLTASAKNAFERGGKDPLAKNTITVSAESKKLVVPDTAQASFTIRKENASLVTARDEASKASNKVIEYLKGQSVDEKDIKSTSYNMYPQEVYDSRPCVLSSGSQTICPPRKTTKTYVIEQTFDVKIKNLDKAGDIIAGVSNVGVNQVGSLQFTVNDETRERLQKEARDEAIKKARENAKVLAGSLGVSLGDLASFNEGGSSPYPIYFGKGGGVAMDSVAGSPAPAITPGQNEIVSTVSLTYEIR